MIRYTSDFKKHDFDRPQLRWLLNHNPLLWFTWVSTQALIIGKLENLSGILRMGNGRSNWMTEIGIHEQSFPVIEVKIGRKWTKHFVQLKSKHEGHQFIRLIIKVWPNYYLNRNNSVKVWWPINLAHALKLCRSSLFGQVTESFNQ